MDNTNNAIQTIKTFTKEHAGDIKLSDKNSIIAGKIDMRISEGKAVHEQVCKDADDNMKLFRGVLETINSSGKKKQEKITIPTIFSTVRNLVGLATDSPAFVEILPADEMPKSVESAKSIETNVESVMMDANFTEKLAMALIDTMVKRDSFLHWYWNFENDDADVDAVMIEELTIAPGATDVQGAEYVIYHPWRNRSWWKENYPKHYDKIKFRHRKTVAGKFSKPSVEIHDASEQNRGNTAQLIRYYERDLLIEKVLGEDGKDIILTKSKNPYYEYRTGAEQLVEFIKENTDPFVEESLQAAGLDIKDITEEQLREMYPKEQHPEVDAYVPVKNYLKKARKPFVQIPSIKVLGELYSENLVGNIKSVFLSMNEKKRAYNDNLRGCNQKIVVDSDVLTEDETNLITNEPNQVVRVSFSENPRPLYVEKGGEVPQSFHADIAHDEKIIDDLFAHHEISRGAGGANTLGQDQMNAESDRIPTRFQTRATERAMVELVEGWLQLFRMFYTKKHYAKRFGSSKEGLRVIELVNEDISDGVKPFIKPGSMIPLSRAVRAARAVEMFMKGAIDPYTMFVDLDVADPLEKTNRLVNWMQHGIISAEDPERLAMDMQSDNPGVASLVQADKENNGFQAGDEFPPTPPELLTPEHVKSHFDFLNDKSKKMSDEDRELLEVHAEVDKQALAQLIAEQEMAIQQQGGVQEQQGQPTGQEEQPERQ
jgi:hypothetical protein